MECVRAAVKKTFSIIASSVSVSVNWRFHFSFVAKITIRSNQVEKARSCLLTQGFIARSSDN